jgi:Bacterial membrane protein YfhO
MSSSASRLADLFAVKYVFVENSRSAASGHFRPVPGVPGLVENAGAFPRAWLAYRWRSAGDAHRALALVAGHRDLKAQPVIETPARPDVAVPQAPDAVRFERDGMQEVTLRLNARAPGQLILGDMFYPGWKAFVDGHQTPIHAANVAFRAVAVPRGRHTVRFRYQPAVLAVGLWTSVASLLAIVLISIWLGMRRRRVAAGHGRGEMLNPTATLTNRNGSPQAEAIPQPHE